MAKLDESSTPPWVPKTRIWSGVTEFGIDGAAAAVDARLEELGGKARVETPRDVAKRLQVAAERRAADKAFLDSYAGVAAAGEAVKEIKSLVEAETAAMRDAGTKLAFMEKQGDANVFGVRGFGASLVMGWWSYRNTTDGSGLLVTEYRGTYVFGGMHDASVAHKTSFRFALDRSGEPAWIEDSDPGRHFSSRQLTERYLKRLLDAEYRSSTL